MENEYAALVTDAESLHNAVSDATRVESGARVVVEARRTVDDPFDAYRRARGPEPGFYLETTGGDTGWGYFGVEPDEFLRVGPDEESALDVLETRLEDEHLIRADCSVPHPGGLFGWLSYDISRDLESLPGSAIDDRHLPRMQFGVYPVVAAWKEPFVAGTPLRLLAAVPLTHSEESSHVSRTDIVDALDVGRERVLSLDSRIRCGDPAYGDQPTSAGATPTHNHRTQTTEPTAFESRCGRAAFEERVHRIKAYIRDGETFQTNVSHRLEAPASVHPVAVYDALRSTNPAPYSALVEFPAVDLVSASPELLLAKRNRALVTEPIAGTRPRGDTDAEDEDLVSALTGDEKERAEHAMLVDLERNDLGKVSEYGSVEVSDYRRVDRYSEVMHLVSEVQGNLRDDATLSDAIAAVFPGGTITGAPKPRTMELVDEVETTRRGPYTGSIAAIGFDGDATLNIIIRTLVRWADEYHLRVGAGIVSDSEPTAEYTETLDKARALVNAIDDALGADETLTLNEDSTPPGREEGQ